MIAQNHIYGFDIYLMFDLESNLNTPVSFKALNYIIIKISIMLGYGLSVIRFSAIVGHMI